mmetsp:Transcript_47401/g.60878  ORF Transcript_47401/g.60878 Transcript_47401/m.60878 type:complete len:552 (-) Transcript_47401:41-1696(-)|eukprot:CAMPEP_0114349378 /NCGR_PEP_ID=MMETSP0101-20121206/15494_1 /TAXON_ID=38822 ORGANISM="Pteridomonas danica, Strain PT" /NCGR_SAMPLE_ID=MMETSP0101 /ASSEMBLY_ACC=CAM_ASM_000211 /LENGTH=551 /DNA_ID=CAMNT_0001487935 /DNA_START=37 /DNA_END=1692 /DNA_ORIENTATION=-
MAQEEGGFTLHFGDHDDWENVSIEKLTLTTDDDKIKQPTPQVEQPNILDSLDGDIPGQPHTPHSTVCVEPPPSSEGDIDPMLLEALETPNKRLTVLKYEDLILNFVRDSSKQTFTLPQMSSYQRLLIHRLSDRFNLDREAVDSGGLGGFTGGNSNGDYDQPIRSITLIKTPNTQVPSLLINQSAEKETPNVEIAQPPRNVKMMLKRNPKGANDSNNNKARGSNNKNNSGVGSMSMTEREAKYAAAKARIFGDEAESDELTTRTPSPAQQTANLAKGPEGSGNIGFGGSAGMGRGGRSTSDNSLSNPSSAGPLVNRSGSDSTHSRTNLEPTQNDKLRESPPPRPNSAGGKGSNNGKGGRGKRATQKNAAIDQHDPDFIRQDRQGKGSSYSPYPVQPTGYYDPRMAVPNAPFSPPHAFDAPTMRPSQVPPPGMFQRPPPPPTNPQMYMNVYPGAHDNQRANQQMGGANHPTFIYPPEYQQHYQQAPPQDQQYMGRNQQYQHQPQYQQPHFQQPQHQQSQQHQRNGGGGRNTASRSSSQPVNATVSMDEFPALG